MLRFLWKYNLIVIKSFTLNSVNIPLLLFHPERKHKSLCQSSAWWVITTHKSSCERCTFSPRSPSCDETTEPEPELNPESPFGPTGPLSPLEPFSPLSPFSPLAPLGPEGPVASNQEQLYLEQLIQCCFLRIIITPTCRCMLQI